MESKTEIKSGRKPIKDGVPSVTISIRLTPTQKAKLRSLGGAAWIRDRINRAR